jgi:HEAT repeat protein
MINKDQLQELKQEKLSDIYNLLKKAKDNREILFVLENLGHLPNNFDGNVFIPFLQHVNDDIRFWAVKNIGKISNPKAIDILIEVTNKDTDSMVRREAVSSIGRMRLPQSEPMLIKLLDDTDPKIVLQAIRGLLVFKESKTAREALLKLEHHPNETIQSVIRREFSKNGKTSNNTQPHPSSPNFMKNTVVNGDVREILN